MSTSETSQVQVAEDVIDLGIGQPQLSLLPRDLMLKAAQQMLAKPDNTPLNYGHGKGDGRFRLALANYLSQGYGSAVDPDLLMASNGASGALHLIAQQFAEPGDTILVEEPTYFLAHRVFTDRGLKLVGVPMAEDGVDLGALEQAVKEHNPRFFYTIPVFQNPTGITLSAPKRSQLVEMAKEFNFLVVADEVYQLLHFGSKPPPPLASQVDSGVVLSVGSFSKILAPGLRLGWIHTSPHLQTRLLDFGLLKSGGGLNHFMGCLVEPLLSSGWQGEFLEGLIRTYSQRVEVMDQSLRDNLAGVVDYSKPKGGFFFWLRLPEGVDAGALTLAAGEAKVGFRAGSRFSSCGGFQNYIRICFARYGEQAIREGISRLASVLS